MKIQVVDLSKRFDQNQVLKNLNITFTDGKVNCVMGVSGVGKTTLINILMDLIKQDTGEIHGLKGSQIAAVFQEDRLIEHLDAMKNVQLVCDKTMTEEVIEQEFRLVGLEEYKNKPVRELSGGMKRRVTVVRAILAKSDLIIMDEPFKGLDEKLKKQVMEYVRIRTIGKTVIIVTHEKDEVQALGGELILLTQDKKPE